MSKTNKYLFDQQELADLDGWYQQKMTNYDYLRIYLETCASFIDCPKVDQVCQERCEKSIL